MASPSASYGIGNNYSAFDIFINHRGPDVKKGLATHLYQRLSAHGLRVFLDKEELQAGDNLTPQINGAIKTASVHIAIFSPRYAESSWCLDELAQILESQRTIIPVFYNVNPSELRWTRGGQGVYARALGILEKRTYDSQPRYDSRTLAKWRKALCDVAEISGFELKECNGDEGQLTDKVVHQVLKRVTKTPLNVAKYPTGLDEKVEDLERTVFLQQQSEKARVVGIVGLGGVGKTTLAKEFFNSHRSNYDRSCFLFDVRENAAKSSLNLLQRTLIKELAQSDVHISSTDEGIEELKRHLSPSHRSLIVLDDVDHISQLDALFLPLKYTIHSSSLILVTSRNKDILTSSGIIESFIYKQTGLNQQHSRELFCSHVFDQPYPVTEFERLVKKFLDVCDGLPLSIKVIGALLCGKDLEYWEAQLHKISKVPPRDILSRLKISYDSLDDDEKNIFLDIACFFIGEDRNTAIRIWDGSDWQGWLSLRNLESKCLVEVDSENCMRMHDHLRDLGRDIAKKETPYRLWHSADYLLHNLRDQSYVRGVSMVHGNGPEQSFEIPKNMRRLELLRTEGHRVKDILSDAQSPQLVWLCWYSCPFSSLPSWISVKNLRVLYIQGGKLDTLWQHESEAPLQLRELKIDANLSEVPKSIGKLKHLEKIVLCWKKYIGGETVDPVDLETLPDEVSGMENLKHLELESCKNMRLLPDSAGNWRKLQWIVLGWCSALQGLPDSAGNWTKLQRIDLRWCSALQGLPDSTGNWANLHHVNLRGCSALQRLPESAGNWTNLHHIDLGGCVALQGLPDSAGNWTNLHHIDLGRCSALQGLPDSAGNWTNLHRINLYQCSAFQRLPDSAGNWTSLQHIDLGWCSALQGLPDSAGNWTNLQRIDLGGCSALQRLPDSAGNWTNLQRIDLGFCSALQDLPDSAGNWTFLQRIDLTGCSALQVLPDSSGEWTNLQHIDLGWCSALQVLPDSAGNWTFLKRLDLAWCSALQGLPASLLNWTHLESMDWTGCSALGLLRFVRAPRYRPELQVTETYRLGPVLRFAGAAPLRDVKEGAITKRMTAIEEMAGMDVLCSDKTGTLTLNKLTVDKNLVEVFAKGVDKDVLILMAARASRIENQDAIDAAIVGVLADPKEARAGIQEVHFLPFNPTDKRTALTYIDREGRMHRVSKGAPEQILALAHKKSEIERKVHTVISKFADRGLRSLAVAYQEVPDGKKESPGGPWQFIGLMPLFDPPRHDSAETIRRALNLGVSVKMITGDQLAIGKETGRRLGMGTNMYPSSSLLGQARDDSAEALEIDDLIEKADGFAGVFPEHKYEIVKRLQARKHICGMTGDGVNDAPALKKADIGIAVADATDAARSASDIVLTEPGLSVIISAVLTSRAIFQRMKNYTIYAVCITIRIVLGFMLLALIWKFDFPPFMVLIIAILNDGTIMTISKDKVKPSPLPDSWNLSEIFATGVIIGSYLAMMTVIFFWVTFKTDFFPRTFGVSSLHIPSEENTQKLNSAVYLQVSTISQALIFVTRSRSWSFVERPGLLLVTAFAIAQLGATLIAVYLDLEFASIRGIGWGWAGVIWLYNIIFYLPLDLIKFAIRYAISGRAWDLLIQQRVAFTTQKDFGREAREIRWAHAQRTLHGLQPPDTKLFGDRSSFRELNQMAEEAKRRAEIARLREINTLKGHVESVVRLKGLDINTIQQSYTV